MLIRFVFVVVVLASTGIGQAVAQPPSPPPGVKPRLPQKETFAGESTPPLVPPIVLQHDGQIASLCFSPDARLLASSTNMGMAHLWEVTTGRLLWSRTLTENASIHALAFSPNGKSVACGGVAQVTLLDAASGKTLDTLKVGGRGLVWSVAFSPGGNRLACAVLNSFVVWDLKTRKRELIIDRTADESARAVTFSPDGKLLAGGARIQPRPPFTTQSVGDSPVWVWDSHTGKELSRFEGTNRGPIYTLTFAPSGKLLACSYYSGVEIKDVATGKTSIKIGKLDEGKHAAGATFSSDGDLLVTAGSADSPPRICETATGKEVQILAKGTHYFDYAAFSPDSRAVALGSLHGVVIVQRLVPAGIKDAKAPLQPDDIRQLWGNLDTSDVQRRYQAIWSFAAVPTSATETIAARLRSRLPSANQDVGQSCIRILELIGTHRARQLLENLSIQSGFDESFKQEAAAALSRLKARDSTKPVHPEPGQSPHDR